MSINQCGFLSMSQPSIAIEQLHVTEILVALWGDEGGTLGRRRWHFGETKMALWGDEDGTLGRRIGKIFSAKERKVVSLARNRFGVNCI
jgi:hypothetical protein